MSEFSRRSFLLLGLAFLTGCAGEQSVSSLPGTPWASGRDRNHDSEHEADHTIPNYQPTTSDPHNTSKLNTVPPYGLPTGVIPRSRWATGNPIQSRLNPMTRIYRITVHHDGMDAFWSSGVSDTKARLDNIRKAHLGRNFGDIGYHYIVDRAGRVWEGRPIVYQGAHVKYHNPGNIGVMCLGNFDLQSPTNLQLAALNQHVALLMRRWRVPVPLIFTHQELRPTACPGHSMQQHMVMLRRSGFLA